MAASLKIHEMSALAAGTDKTSGTVRFKDADNATVDLNNPLVIPSGADIYSYTKQLRLYMADPPGTQLNNLRCYSADGSNDFGTGIAVTAKNKGVTYAANFKTAQSGGADLFGYTSGSALDCDASDPGPFTASDDDSYIGDLIELQMSISALASHGALTPESLVFAWDEI